MVKIYTSSRYKIDKKKITDKISQYLKERGFTKQYTLNIVIMGRRKMGQIAKKYKQADEALPVLSFSYLGHEDKAFKEEDNLIGEVFICYPEVILMAAKREKKVDQMIVSLVEHGIETIIRQSSR